MRGLARDVEIAVASDQIVRVVLAGAAVEDLLHLTVASVSGRAGSETSRAMIVCPPAANRTRPPSIRPLGPRESGTDGRRADEEALPIQAAAALD